MTNGSVETPSGKGAGDENFPVGSWLLPAALRPHVAKFYAFARAIDDIADNPALAPDDKIARLERFEAAIQDDRDDDPALGTAHLIRDSLAATGVPRRHCLDLIAAFKQDALKGRYGDWGELIGYCELSANPVGRYLLDLHGEDRADYPASDGLCSALQVLNHLQDCQDDYRQLDRVYLPLDWLGAEGLGVEVLEQDHSPAGLRRVIDRCLDGVEELMVSARGLPDRLVSTRLAMESTVIVKLADRLARLLRAGDPLAARVALGKADFLRCGLGAVATVAWRRRPRSAKSPPNAAAKDSS
jgi:squalene synthase HpnC